MLAGALPAFADAEALKLLSSEVNRLVIERADQLPRRKLDDVTLKMEEIKSMLRGGTGGGEIVVTGQVESFAYTFIGNSLGEVLDQCRAFHARNNIGQADDVTVVVNGGQQHAYHTGGWWTTADQVCQQVYQGIVDSNAVPSGDIVVSGSIENYGFLFIGRSIGAIKTQCLDFHQRNAIGQVDDVSGSVNGMPVDSRHTGGWWTTADSVCNVVVEIVVASGRLPPGQLLVRGTIESMTYSFAAQTIREINEQCLAFHASNSIGQVDDITVQVNTSAPQSFHTGGWWTTADQVCTVVITAIPNQ